MLCTPRVSDEVVYCAVPPADSGTVVRMVAPSLNWTEPTGGTAPPFGPMATVAVKVTLVPIREVLFGLDEASVVTVP